MENREEFIEVLRDGTNEEIYPYAAKLLLVEAGLDEELAYYLAQRIVNGTKTVMRDEVKKHLETTLYWLERV